MYSNFITIKQFQFNLDVLQKRLNLNVIFHYILSYDLSSKVTKQWPNYNAITPMTLIYELLWFKN